MNCDMDAAAREKTPGETARPLQGPVGCSPACSVREQWRRTDDISPAQNGSPDEVDISPNLDPIKQTKRYT